MILRAFTTPVFGLLLCHVRTTFFATHSLLSSARSNAITYLVFLMGICMPMYIDCPLRKQGMNYLGFGCYGCLFVWNNYVDIQVHDFVSRNQKPKEKGEPAVPNLD